MKNIYPVTRYVVLIAVFGSLLVGAAMLVYGGVEAVRLALGMLDGSKASAKEAAVAAIKVVDLFLIGTVMYIIALGLYELFIDEHLPVPAWLEIHSLDDLKHKLIGVLVVVMAVFFLEQLVAWDGGQDLLYIGAPIALLIAALGYFLKE